MRVKIPCLVARKAKSGKTSWYWQPSATLRAAGWQAVALGKDEGAAIAAARQRNADVDRWKLGGAPQTGQGAGQVTQRQATGTLGELIALYRRKVVQGTGPDGKPRVAPATAKNYETSLKRLDTWAGKHPLAFITRKRVHNLRDAMLGTIGHDPAHKTLKVGRQLFAFAIDQELVEQGRNPFESFGLAAPAPRDVVWSRPAREAMIAAAHAAQMPSMALAIQLGFAIGQREADILGLTPQKYVPIPEHLMQPEDYATLAGMAADGVPRGIRVRQGKTMAWVEVPVVGEVRRTVESNIARARDAGQLAVILDDTRLPLAPYRGEAGQTRFQRDFGAVRTLAAKHARSTLDEALAAELEGIQFRDLRRTCVVYLGELGLDAHLIAAITGHDIDETQRILKTYMPRTTGRAARAIALSAVREQREADKAEAALSSPRT